MLPPLPLSKGFKPKNVRSSEGFSGVGENDGGLVAGPREVSL